jgi:hypothetical protein
MAFLAVHDGSTGTVEILDRKPLSYVGGPSRRRSQISDAFRTSLGPGSGRRGFAFASRAGVDLSSEALLDLVHRRCARAKDGLVNQSHPALQTEVILPTFIVKPMGEMKSGPPREGGG